MATFDDHRRLTSALGTDGAEAVAGFVDASTNHLTTRQDLEVLRAEIRGDLYRALWIQGGVIITTITALAGLAAAIITALG